MSFLQEWWDNNANDIGWLIVIGLTLCVLWRLATIKAEKMYKDEGKKSD